MLTDIVKASGISASSINSLYQSNTNVGNAAGGGATTLEGVTLPAGVFDTDGDRLDFRYFGNFTGAAITDLYLLFGSDIIFTAGAVDPAASSDWSMSGTIIRINSTQYQSIVDFSSTGLGTCQAKLSSNNAFSDAITLILFGQGTSLNDILFRQAIRQFHLKNR